MIEARARVLLVPLLAALPALLLGPAGARADDETPGAGQTRPGEAFIHPDPARGAFQLIYESRDERRRTIKGREPSVSLRTLALTATISSDPEGVTRLSFTRLEFHPEHLPSDKPAKVFPGHAMELKVTPGGNDVHRFLADDDAPPLPKALVQWLRRTFAEGLPELVDGRLLTPTKGVRKLPEDQGRALLGLTEAEGVTSLAVKRSATSSPKPRVTLDGDVTLRRLGDLPFRDDGRLTLKLRAAATTAKPGAPCEVTVSRTVTGTLAVEGISAEREVKVTLNREHRWQRKPLDRPAPKPGGGAAKADD